MEDTLRDLEYTLAFHGAPALAGIKPVDLVAWGSPQGCRVTVLEDYLRQLSLCGSQLRLLGSCRPRCLILVYRPERLAAQLARPQVRALLARMHPDQDSHIPAEVAGADRPLGGRLFRVMPELVVRDTTAPPCERRDKARA